MKILYISSNFYPYPGGTQLAARSFLRFLTLKGIDCQVITQQNDFYKETSVVDNIFIIPIKNHNKIFSLVKTIHPDLLLTDLRWAFITVKAGQINNVPTAYIARTYYFPNFLYDPGLHPDIIICGSYHQRRKLLEKGVFSYVMHSPFDINDYIYYKAPSKRYITIINPQKVKGGDIFVEIAKALPYEQFLVVLGWETREQPQMNKAILNKLKKCTNVVIMKPTFNMKKVYRQTKILLFPSRWQEVFGRVCFEALLNGIPVISSGTGGNKEALCDVGIVVHNNENISEWIEKIAMFRDKSLYSKVSSNARQNSRKYYEIYKQDQEAILRIFYELVSSSLNKTKIIRVLQHYYLLIKNKYLGFKRKMQEIFIN